MLPSHNYRIGAVLVASASCVALLFASSNEYPAYRAMAAITISPDFGLVEEEPFAWRIDEAIWPREYEVADLVLVVTNADPSSRDLYKHEFDLAFRLDFRDSRASCVALNQVGSIGERTSLADLWKGFDDERAYRQLTRLSKSAVPFTVVFVPFGRDAILRRATARLELIPPYFGSALLWEGVIWGLRHAAALTILIGLFWLGRTAKRAA